MKTKRLIFILGLILSLSWFSCEDDNPMPKFTGDYASFIETSYYLNILPEFEYLEIPVYHKNPSKIGSEIGVEVITTIPSTIYSLDKTTINFDDNDTAIIKLTLRYSQMTDCESYSLKIKFIEDDNYLQVAYDGIDSVVVDFIKYKPIVKSEFIGTWDVVDYSDYYGDISYQVEITDAPGDTMIVDNLWEYGDLREYLEPVRIIFDDSDPSKFIFSIPDQYYSYSTTYMDVYIGQWESGTFSVCDKTIYTSYVIYVTAGIYDDVLSSVWTKVAD